IPIKHKQPKLKHIQPKHYEPHTTNNKPNYKLHQNTNKPHKKHNKTNQTIKTNTITFIPPFFLFFFYNLNVKLM
ncbi:MAG: hypothetical protein PHY59_07350, partial [Methanobacterium sp.]|nr:hypothetical protein [Methanobacterium sp.]